MSAQDKASQWVKDNLDEINANYLFEWIAVAEDGVVAHSQDLDEITNKLDELGLTLEDVVLQFVDGM